MAYYECTGGGNGSKALGFPDEDILDWGINFPYSCHNAEGDSVGNAGISPTIDVTNYSEAYIYCCVGARNSSGSHSSCSKTFYVKDASTGTTLGSVSIANKTYYNVKEKAKAAINLSSIIGEVYFTTNAKANYEDLFACTAIHLVK